MPGGDQTGPQGEGPRTGRGLGYCADNVQPGYATPQQGQRFGFQRGGRGLGNRRGRGRWNRSDAGFGVGRGRGGFAVLSDVQDQDIDSLKAQMRELQNTLKEIQDHLDQFEK